MWPKQELKTNQQLEVDEFNIIKDKHNVFTLQLITTKTEQVIELRISMDYNLSKCVDFTRDFIVQVNKSHC